MTRHDTSGVQALIWTGCSLKILDQRQLPDKFVYDEYADAPGVAKAITGMQVRGAPAIGIAAAYGVALSVINHMQSKDDEAWRKFVDADVELLADSRPTAVNLFWALNRMKALLNENPDGLVDAVKSCAEQIHAEDIAANHKMGELGADMLSDVKGVLTHCNTGSLATGGYGTALGVIRSAYARNQINVYAGETRPWQQGLRLTVWELAQDGIPVTLIADSAAAWLMKSGAIGWAIVGADRIALNGDVANKIGTYSLAVLAKQHNVKVMVVAPTSSIDGSITHGSQIEIEERKSDELLPVCYAGNPKVRAWNPVFDITPVELITAIVTERGVVVDPSKVGVGGLL